MFITAVYAPDVDVIRLAVNVADDGCTLQEEAGREGHVVPRCTQECTSREGVLNSITTHVFY